MLRILAFQGKAGLEHDLIVADLAILDMSTGLQDLLQISSIAISGVVLALWHASFVAALNGSCLTPMQNDGESSHPHSAYPETEGMALWTAPSWVGSNQDDDERQERG